MTNKTYENIRFETIKKFYDKYKSLRTLHKVPIPVQDAIADSINSLKPTVDEGTALITAERAKDEPDLAKIETIENARRDATVCQVKRAEAQGRFTQAEMEDNLWYLFSDLPDFDDE